MYLLYLLAILSILIYKIAPFSTLHTLSSKYPDQIEAAPVVILI
jgi:hypothetical protein